MNVALRPRITKEEFLEWEDRQELRYEFDGYRAIAMFGGTQAHDIIAMNIAFELQLRLGDGPCRFHSGGMKIEVAGRIRYPDAFVVCSPVEPKGKLITDPVVVFEVQSESTALIDQTIKNEEYCATPSIRRYVMLSQSAVVANVYARIGSTWTGSLITGSDGVLSMPEIGVELPLGLLYRRLSFDVTGAGQG